MRKGRPYIEVDDVRARRKHRLDVLAKLGEVGRQDGRRDRVLGDVSHHGHLDLLAGAHRGAHGEAERGRRGGKEHHRLHHGDCGARAAGPVSARATAPTAKVDMRFTSFWGFLPRASFWGRVDFGARPRGGTELNRTWHFEVATLRGDYVATAWRVTG